MKLGVFSGTFNPIHEGHVLFALTVLDQFGLDKIVFMPEPKPRRKDDVTLLESRVAMVELALGNYAELDVLVSDADESHSIIKTIESLKDEYGDDIKITLLMGADVFEYIEDWKDGEDDYKDLLEQVEFLVALRSEDDGEIVIPLADRIDADAQFIQAPVSGISSTMIREGKLKYLDDEVLEYIKKKQLYSKD